MGRRASVFLAALAVLASGWADGLSVLPKPEPALRYWQETKDWRGESGISGKVIARPCFNAKGTRLYCVADRELQPGQWKAARFDVGRDQELDDFTLLDYGRRHELAVVPSPDESRLLLLLKLGDAARLAVADRSATITKRFEGGLDPQRSQFAWSADGAFIYYSIPVEGGEGMALRRATPDGETLETLIESGVVEFDAARQAERVVALVGGKLLVLEGGKVVKTLEPEGPIEAVRLSPDGSRAAWGGRRLVVYDLDGEQVVAATSPPAEPPSTDHRPAWSPAGDALAFERAFHVGGADGPIISAGLGFFYPESKTETVGRVSPSTRRRIEWSPAGKLIVYEMVELGAEDFDRAERHEPSELVPAPDGAAWTRLPTPAGAAVNTYAVAPSNGRIVYASAGTLYVTGDGGDHWRPVEMTRGKAPPGKIEDLAVDPADPKVLYAVAEYQVWCSKDLGRTWARLCPDDKGWGMLRIAPSPTEPGVVYECRGNKTIVRYESGKVTELHTFKGNPEGNRLTIDPCNPKLIVYSDLIRGTGVSVYSTDGGRSWHKPKSPPGEGQILFLAGDAEDETLLFAQVFSGRVFFSTDGGETWELYADPDEPGLWTDAVRRVCVERFPLPAAHREAGWVGEPLTAQRDAQQPDRIYVIMRGQGLYRSDDGGTKWQPANTGLGMMAVGAFIVAPDRPGHLVIFGPRVMATHDGGKDWEPSAFPEGDTGTLADVAADPQVAGRMFFSSGARAVCRSRDYGVSWEEMVGNYKTLDVGFWGRFAFDPQERDHVMVYAEGGVLDSKDGGLNWKVTSKFQPLPREFYEPQMVGRGEVITVCDKGNWRVFQSRDLGRSWRIVEGPFRGRRPMVMAGGPADSRALYFVTEYDWATHCSVLWASVDLGDTWEARPLPERFAHATALVCNPAAPEMLAVGLDDGCVWLSLDEGRQWRDLGSGLPTNEEVRVLSFSPAENRLYALLKHGDLYWIELPAAQ
jgi:photosystem II stability/assembly factor-like uncharacterized protein